MLTDITIKKLVTVVYSIRIYQVSVWALMQDFEWSEREAIEQWALKFVEMSVDIEWVPMSHHVREIVFSDKEFRFALSQGFRPIACW